MSLRTIVYLSTTSPMAQEELESLLLDARQNNASNGITGVLLYSRLHFMQCIEGPEDALQQTYARILASRRHRGIVELQNRIVETRQFSQWTMGLCQPTESELLNISNAQWNASRESPGQLSPGFNLLDAFWRTYSSEPRMPVQAT